MHKVNQDTYARLFKYLLHVPATAHELAAETGIHIVTAQSLMRCLKKHKVVHISSWEKDTKGRDATPVYTLGLGRDKPREKLSVAERQRRYRDKKAGLVFQNVLFGEMSNEHINIDSGIDKHSGSCVGSGLVDGRHT